MSNEFVREERYIVFKVSDVERYLTDKDRANIAMMKMEIAAGRDCANKPPFKGLIVEADWPEYEPTWRAIEARVTGAPYESAVQVAARIMNHELITERDALRSEYSRLQKEADKFEDGIDWIQRALQAEAKVEEMRGRLPCQDISKWPNCGAQPAPSEHDKSVRKSWARFSHELHRSPDAPYPGMSEAFEQHFSQSFTDREWRAEAATWAAAWKAAKRHGAQPAPSVPEGWRLVPTEPTQEIRDAWTSHVHESFRVAYQAMLEVAQETKS